MNSLPARAPLAGVALAVAGAIAFSGKSIIVKLGLREGVDAITLITLRMLLALPLFLAAAWWAGRGKAGLSARDLRLVAVLGFLGYYLASTLDFLGLQYISASLERLIQYLGPTLVLLITRLVYKRPIQPLQLAALGVSYLGLLIVFGREWRVEGAHTVLGAGLVLASTLSYAFYLVFSGEEVKRLGALRLTGWATTVACLLCLLQHAVLQPGAGLAAVPARVWWLSVLNAVACTFAPVLMVMMAIERIGAPRAAQLGMIGPVSTVGLGVWVLGEPFTAFTALGTLLVLAGVAWLARLK